MIVPFHSKDFTSKNFLKKTIYFSYHESVLFDLSYLFQNAGYELCDVFHWFCLGQITCSPILKVLFKFVCEPIFMLNPLPILNDFFLLILVYQMNNILIILKKINQTGNIEKKRMPFQCHSCGPTYYLWTSLKNKTVFCHMWPHIWNFRVSNWKETSRSFIETFSIPKSNIWFKRGR